MSKYRPYFNKIIKECRSTDACVEDTIKMGDRDKNRMLDSGLKLEELEEQEETNFLFEPVVSIIIPTCNKPAQFSSAMIESVLQQTYKKWELCIVDDGSKKQSHIERIISRYAHDSRIKYKLLGENEKTSETSNTALQLIQGDYLGFLGHNYILAPFALYEVVKAINYQQEPDFLYSYVDNFEYVNKERIMLFFRPDLAADMLTKCNYRCSFSVLKKSLIDRIGSCSSSFEGNQEQSLVLSAVKNADRVVYIPNIVCHCNDQKKSITLNTGSNLNAFQIGNRVPLEDLQRLGISPPRREHVKNLISRLPLEKMKNKICAQGSEIIEEYKTVRDINSIKAEFRTARQQELEAFLSAKRKLDFSTPTSPKLTILLVLWNQAELTLACLRALHKQDNGTFEVLIVDNASSDATKQLLSMINGIRVITNAENMGFLKAVNMAAYQAQGQYLLLLNNDAVVRQESIQRAIARIESAPDIGAVGGRVILPNGMLQEAGSIVWQDGSCLGYRRGESPDNSEAMFVREVDYCSGVFLLTKTELFCQMGGFDVKYAPAYYEDTDYCTRLWKRGLKVVYDPAVVLDHFEYGSAALNEQASQQMEINEKKFLSTHSEFLIKHFNYSNPNILYARMKNDHKGRVLFIDDRVPLKNLGAGFPRAKSILQAINEKGWFITFYPLNEPNLVDDWQDIYEAIPDTIEVIRGYGMNKLERFLTDRAGYYDVLFISRPPNMMKINRLYNKRPDLFSGLKIIYDAEAIWSIREIQKSKLNNKSISDHEVARHIHNELAVANVAHAILAVSNQEAQYFTNAGYTDVHVLGHALAASPTPKNFEERKDILFVGRLEEDGSPNVDSIMWFVSEVLPLINAGSKEPIKLYLIGKNGAKTIKRINSPYVVSLGAIDDLTDWYNNCRIFIAPTRFAAGIPLKVPEASAYGIPVVVTPILEKQLSWRHEQEVLVGETAAEFAEQCRRLYNDKELWQRIRENAINRIFTDHSISHFANTIEKVLSK